jgi:hypothetical protein
MLKFILVVMSFAMLSFSGGDNADDIYKKFAEKKGFKQLDSINDFKVSGKSITSNDTSRFEYYFMKPNSHRMHIVANQIDLLMVYDEENGFLRQGMFPPLPMEDRGKSLLIQMRDMILSSVYPVYGTPYKYKLEKDEQIAGNPVYKLIRIDSTGKFMDLFISKKDLSLIKTIVVNEFKEMNVLTEISYDNYTDFKGIKIPMSTKFNLSDTKTDYKIDSVLFNIGLRKFDFRRP